MFHLKFNIHFDVRYRTYAVKCVGALVDYSLGLSQRNNSLLSGFLAQFWGELGIFFSRIDEDFNTNESKSKWVLTEVAFFL